MGILVETRYRSKRIMRIVGPIKIDVEIRPGPYSKLLDKILN